MSKTIKSVLKVGDGCDPECFTTSTLISLWENGTPNVMVIRDKEQWEGHAYISLKLTDEQAEQLKSFLAHLERSQ